MRGRMDLNMEDLAMVSGGTVVRETGGCVMGQIEKQHVHHYIKIGENWISPPGGVYVSYHLQCTECGHDYWSEYENMLK